MLRSPPPPKCFILMKYCSISIMFPNFMCGSVYVKNNCVIIYAL